MENGHTSISDGSSDPVQHGEENSADGKAKPLLAPASISGHKRSLSGNILSFPFFGGSQSRQDVAPKSPIKIKPQAESLPSSPRSGKGAMASVMQQTKTRKRKGSLRKEALLGGKARLESSEKQDFRPEKAIPPTNSDRRDPSPQTQPTPKAINPIPPQVPSHTKPTFNIPQPHPAPPSGTALHRLEATKPIIRLNDPLPIPSIPPKPNPPPTISSTTTSDDDFPAPLKKPPLPGSHSDSYFPPIPRARHHRQSPLASLLSSTVPSSPLAGTPSLSSPQQQERQQHQQHDYAETRAWGWVLLATTWIVVVVGMGSCLGVWSWAWDVGETPYAPPELEDDPTLPIVGYYPALIILTGVMAWVWVVVAWVGMKYFRHATMGGEES